MLNQCFVLRLLEEVAVARQGLGVDLLRDLGDKFLVSGACWLSLHIFLEIIRSELSMLKILLVEPVNCADDVFLHLLRCVQRADLVEVIPLPHTLFIRLFRLSLATEAS